MKITMFLFFIFTLNAWADCQVFDGFKTIIIPENKSSTLYEKGKSLENFQIQDQDGIGTCHANAASVVLKTILPGQPDISYTHAAMVALTRGWTVTGWGKGGSAKYIGADNTDFVSNGGQVCETIAALKSSGGACPKKLSLLEGQDYFSPESQSEIFMGLGKYFDYLNDSKKNPKLKQSLEHDLARLIENIKNKNSDLARSCLEKKNTKFPLKDALEYLVSSYVADVKPNTNSICFNGRIKLLQKSLLDPSSKIDTDSMNLVVSKNFISRLSQKIESNSKTSSELEKYLANSNDTAEEQYKFGKFIMEQLNTLMLSEAPDKEISTACPDYKEGKSFIVSDEDVRVRSLIMDMKHNKQDECQDLFMTYHFKDISAALQCENPNNLKQLVEGITPLINIGMKADDTLLKKLLDPDSTHANQIFKILNPECADQTRLINMDNVACASFSMCDSSQYIDNTNNVYSGPKDGCYSAKFAKSMFRTKVFSGINNNRSLSVSVCSEMLDFPESKTDYCTKRTANVEKDYPLHVMSISGYRCIDGKVEYQITNSYGTTCPVKGDKPKNASFDCEINEDESPTGLFWVKEDILVNNSTDLITTTIVNKKK